jgi:hypothetical protein
MDITVIPGSYDDDDDDDGADLLTPYATPIYHLCDFMSVSRTPRGFLLCTFYVLDDASV